MATTPTTTIDSITIDAAGKRLGRVASEAAHALLGKHRTDAVKHTVAPVRVAVTNVSRLAIEERKQKGTSYDRYSGYPDGRRELTMEKLIKLKGKTEIMRQAVYGMLPGNRLRAPRMKLLTISE